MIGDIGCGNGALMVALSSYISHGYLYDKSKNNFSQFINKNKKLTCINNITYLPKCDIFICNGVLHHLKPKEQYSLFKNIEKKVKNNGYLILTVAGNTPLLNKIQLILQKALRHTTVESLNQLLTRQGIARGKKTFLIDTLKAKYYYFTEYKLKQILDRYHFKPIKRLKGGSPHSHDPKYVYKNALLKDVIGQGDFRILA